MAGSYSRRFLDVLLGDGVRARMYDGPTGRLYSYHWRWGCVASGVDRDEALSLRACGDHAVTIELAGPRRASQPNRKDLSITKRQTDGAGE